MKSVLLHGEITEDVHINQPIGYHKGKFEMVYKLRKSLYGLIQAPRALYNRI